MRNFLALRRSADPYGSTSSVDARSSRAAGVRYSGHDIYGSAAASLDLNASIDRHMFSSAESLEPVKRAATAAAAPSSLRDSDNRSSTTP